MLLQAENASEDDKVANAQKLSVACGRHTPLYIQRCNEV